MAQVDPPTHKPKESKRTYKIVVDKDKCKSCRLCILYCPSNHLTLSKGLNKKGLLYVEKNEGTCLGCNACVLICPDSCIHLIQE